MRPANPWPKLERGLYTDPSGRWRARRLEHARWQLEGAGEVRGPYGSLAECREIADRLQQHEDLAWARSIP